MSLDDYKTKQPSDKGDDESSAEQGDDLLIKDPIYDIMTDSELTEAENRLTSLIEESEQIDENADEKDTEF